MNTDICDGEMSLAADPTLEQFSLFSTVEKVTHLDIVEVNLLRVGDEPNTNLGFFCTVFSAKSTHHRSVTRETITSSSRPGALLVFDGARGGKNTQWVKIGCGRVFRTKEKLAQICRPFLPLANCIILLLCAYLSWI